MWSIFSKKQLLCDFPKCLSSDFTEGAFIYKYIYQKHLQTHPKRFFGKQLVLSLSYRSIAIDSWKIHRSACLLINWKCCQKLSQFQHKWISFTSLNLVYCDALRIDKVAFGL